MSCITKLLEMKGDKNCLPINPDCVIEGGGNYRDYEYLITFTSHGTRCGYVALKEKETAKFEEEKKNEKYYYPDLDCHGGLTFYGDDHGAKDLLPTPCSDVWVGFDAAHALDIADMKLAEEFFPGHRFIEYRKNNPEPDYDNCKHRSYEYIEQNCKEIIDQILEQVV